MNQKKLAGLIVAATFTLSACSHASLQTSSEFMPSKQQLLVIYTSHNEKVYGPIIREFENRTGIWVEIKTGGSLELLDEIAAGNTDCDLLFGGSADITSAYQECFMPYESPLAGELMEEFRMEGDFCTPFSSLPVVMIYNPKLVHSNIPDSWEDLFDPKWKGKIAYTDPTLSGSGYVALSTMVQALDADPEVVIPALYRNLDGRVLNDSKLVVDAVSEGNFHIGIALEEAALKAVDSGANLVIIYPKEGTSAVPDGTAIAAGCAHEENAKQFIDFLLGTDVQNYLQNRLYRRSVRKDIQNSRTTSSPFELIDYNFRWAADNRETIRSIWSFLTGEGAR